MAKFSKNKLAKAIKELHSVGTLGYSTLHLESISSDGHLTIVYFRDKYTMLSSFDFEKIKKFFNYFQVSFGSDGLLFRVDSDSLTREFDAL